MPLITIFFVFQFVLLFLSSTFVVLEFIVRFACIMVLVFSLRRTYSYFVMFTSSFQCHLDREIDIFYYHIRRFT